MDNQKTISQQILEQELCEDDYIKVPKKALKYRTTGMVAYNAEWLKSHFELERAVICGSQEPSGDAIDRKLVCAFIAGLISDDGEREKGLEYIRNMPPVNPQPCEDAIDRAKAIMIASGYCHPANVAKELAKLPPVNPQPCDDAISRQAVLKAIDAKAWEFCDYLISKGRNDEQKPVSHFADNLRECIGEGLPPVNPTKTGHWIMSEDGLYRPICDVCCAHPWKGYIPTVEEATEVFKYCPNCGCRMVEPQERSE